MQIIKIKNSNEIFIIFKNILCNYILNLKKIRKG